MSLLDLLFGKPKKKQKSVTYIEQNGKAVKADSRYDAWISGDLNRMLGQLRKSGNAVDTHFLYLSISEQTYKQRQDPNMRNLFKQITPEHIEKFGSLKSPLKRDMGGKLPQVPTFKYLATVYTEDGEFEKAIEVCERALSFGLDDGTKTGFKGRIERIKKKIEKKGN